MATNHLPAAEALGLAELVTPAAGSITSRILAKNAGGSVTLFAFDQGEGLTEHTSPFDALVMVLDGALTLTIGGSSVRAPSGTIVRMPAGTPHEVEAPESARMLLIMLKQA